MFEVCDRVVVHNKKQIKQKDIVMPGTPNVAKQQLGGWWTQPGTNWDDFVDIPQLVSQQQYQRQSEEEKTCFVNNLGLGLQFAAVGSVLLEKAISENIGHELPVIWFSQTMRS